MNDVQAALGLSQMDRLDEFIEYREKLANRYTSQLDDLDEVSIVLPKYRSSWYKYILLLNNDFSSFSDTAKGGPPSLNAFPIGNQSPIIKPPGFNKL